MTIRILTEDEEAVVKDLYQKKSEYKETTAFVTTVEEVILKKWDGHHPSNDESHWEIVVIPPGRTLKIVMVSRFGDCGLTDDLNAVHGYHIRLNFEDPSITNIRKNP